MSNFLHGAVDDARGIAGDDYYTGCIVSHPTSRRVTLYLANAPEAVLEELEALHPRVYLIINDAPRPYSAVLEVMETVTMDRAALRDLGIKAVHFSPTPDGYVGVGVLSLVPMAQATYDASYGCGVVRVFETEEGTFFGNKPK
jgi:hypothetical protein